jgi:hypothetical protein
LWNARIDPWENCAADQPLDSDLSGIDYDVDRDARRALIRFRGDIDGRTIQGAMARLSEEHPEIVGYDSICDMLVFSGHISFDDISAIADAWRIFTQGSDRGRRTAVVSNDPFAPVYIKAISLCFSGRSLAVFRTMDDAGRWLESPRPIAGEVAARQRRG